MNDRLPAAHAHADTTALARTYLGPILAAAYERGAGWTDIVDSLARPGNARFLTAAILRLYPELRLVDVVGVIAPASSNGLARPTPGACQTIDAGLAAIDVRGPGWVDHRYPIDAVIPELVDAGFGPHDIVALFNGNVAITRLGPALQAVFADYEPDADHEAQGVTLAQRWRCTLRCCQPRPRRRPLRRWLGGAEGEVPSADLARGLSS